MHVHRELAECVQVPVGTAVSIARPSPAEAEPGIDWTGHFQRKWVGAQDYTGSDDTDSSTEDTALPVQAAGRLAPYADLVDEGQQVCVAHGGRGGKGNAALPTNAHRCVVAIDVHA